MVVGNLPRGVIFERCAQFHDVRVVFTELIRSTITANHNIFAMLEYLTKFLRYEQRKDLTATTAKPTERAETNNELAVGRGVL